VIVDHTKCDGCSKCVFTCRFSGIKQVSVNETSNCDLCLGDPACVGYCPTGAILYMEPAEIQKMLTNETLKRYERCIEALM
jgi:Fe-S-cluster-containing hydrogenase component 2